jgi:flagellar protein FlaG
MEILPVNVPTVQTAQATDASGAKKPEPVKAAAPVVRTAPPVSVQSNTASVEETLRAVAAQIESYLRSNGRALNFSVDSSTGRTVIAVRDTSGALIRQIPSEEALHLAATVGSSGGALLNESV